jgi:hypothetical protein
MARVVEALAGWARRTSWSAFSELRGSSFPDTELTVPAGEPIYRLRHWPSLPSALRTADVLRLLSLMSNRPLNRSWMLKHSRLGAARIDALLEKLVQQGALEVIDTSDFPAEIAET